MAIPRTAPTVTALADLECRWLPPRASFAKRAAETWLTPVVQVRQPTPS